MPRTLSIDYGLKRTGIAVTDKLKIIAQGLTTVKTNELMTFLDNYLATEEVDTIVVGLPLQMNCLPSETEPYIQKFIKKFSEKYPAIKICRVDERFTTILSQKTLLEAGAKKKQRMNKELTDTISATIILQTHLNKTEPK